MPLSPDRSLLLPPLVEPESFVTATPAAGAWMPLRDSGVALVDQLVSYLEGQIRGHGLRTGMRLASVRALAQASGVSRDTVVQAYDRLVAMGLVHSRRGAGFFVSAQRPSPSDGTDSRGVSTAADVTFDTPYLLRGMFRESPSAEFAASTGLLPAQWLDAPMLSAAMRAVGRSVGDSLVGYGIPQGYLPLRQQVASTLQAQDVPAHPEANLMTVAGVTQGLDLIIRLLVRPGDTVLVEDPGWFLVFGRLQAMGVNVVGVPRTAGGPDVQALQALAAQHLPRLFITNTAVHNPTGLTLSAGVAYDVLRVAEQYDFWLVEDDTYADFHPGNPVRLAALDRLRRVLLVGGYAKTLGGSLRVGYIAAEAGMLQQLVDLKLLAGLTCALPSEMMVQRVLADGQYRRHVARVRDRVDKARLQCLRQVEALGWQVPHEPHAGMFVWADCGMDSEQLGRRAARQGLVLAPGLLFSPRQAPGSMLRLAVPMVTHAKAWKLLQQLAGRT